MFMLHRYSTALRRRRTLPMVHRRPLRCHLPQSGQVPTGQSAWTTVVASCARAEPPFRVGSACLSLVDARPWSFAFQNGNYSIHFRFFFPDRAAPSHAAAWMDLLLAGAKPTLLQADDRSVGQAQVRPVSRGRHAMEHGGGVQPDLADLLPRLFVERP